MKVADLSEWQEQLALLAADPNPLAASLRTLVVTWAETAEALLDTPTPPPTPIAALRNTLVEVENRMLGGESRWPGWFIGQALLLLCHHWGVVAEEREAFLTDMTPIEQAMFSDVARSWLAERAKQAQETPNA